ncbi:MAG: trypsin-like peptidase domain-containing protein [Acidobacteria bacterium]|nr:trypsin-like peptidase domain-containing protein [Acidobacteriota bacterium]
MTRRFLVVTVSLAAAVAFLMGLVVAARVGSATPASASGATAPVAASPEVPTRRAASREGALIAQPAAPSAAVSFADIAERLNPAVVSIDATARGATQVGPPVPESPGPFFRQPERDRNGPRRGAGTGFLIDADGSILTNHHVIDGADRIMVQLTDGRTFRAVRVGSDPDTDIALIRIDAEVALPFAPLGDSDQLRVGEWVVAIGNPLAYEHTVTVGVVSFIGRKLFDTSLDRYIQTDAAINFGNSGGPLIDARGDVIGINSAISSRASNIGFAVPINQASAILSQLRETGRVARGFIGVMLRNVDGDLQRALGLPSDEGALVQDVAPGSPGARAGLRPYDVIVAVDGTPIENDDALIETIATRPPGSVAAVRLLRDGRALTVRLKLAERPQRDRQDGDGDERPRPTSRRGPPLGLSVRQLDTNAVEQFGLTDGTRGVVVSRVEPLSAAFDADIRRGHVVLEIDRQPVSSLDDYRRLTDSARPGDVLTMFVYKPEIDQRALETLAIDEP